MKAITRMTATGACAIGFASLLIAFVALAAVVGTGKMAMGRLIRN